ncbi:uncharacterized protein LOC142351212 [Convolutriloba macropyga]|uniref:uncharacterized protein LOC142351212 n=1 Tax=Convolutriloba macropyga TaxID=536237 RepID=UPI003F51C8ED
MEFSALFGPVVLIALTVIQIINAALTTNLKDFTTTPLNEEWESLVFWISMEMGIFNHRCAFHSNFYCLDAYRTRNPFRNGTEEFTPTYEVVSVQTWFTILIRENWRQINMINFDQPRNCCEEQLRKFLVFGYHNKGMNPEEYMRKLTDYEDEDKPLNFIAAVGSLDRCENIIMEVGFGPGNFRRSHHKTVTEGIPYVLAGRQHDDFGNKFLDSRAFEYENPGRQLTFHWFKHNIMCRDHPWICGSEKTKQKSTSNINEGNSSGSKKSTKGGSKKSRRKKQSNVGNR